MSGKKLTGAEGKKTRFPKDFHGVIAPLSIAQGCLSACSYCITQVARGKLKSVPTEDILGDVTSALNQGCKEIQLTAQDTASYGLDITTNLGELLQHVCKIQGTFRVRVGMMNPATLQKNLTSILNAYHHPTMYQFLHLPVQSGDDIILNKMNREYTTKGYTTIINKFRTSIPQLTLATDVIVGFPTETEEQHQNTMTFLQTIQPDIINITRFSARPHTKAKTMNGRIPTHIVKQRSQEITKLSYAISLQKNKKHLGNNYTILVTEHGKQQTVTGRTPHYKQVVIKEPVTIGDFVDVTITDATATYLVGKLK